MSISVLAILTSLITLGYAVALSLFIFKQSPGNEKMREIADAIRKGAKAYLHRQSATILIFTAIIAILLFWIIPKGAHNNNLITSIGFLIGALSSLFAGYAGMSVSVKANVRTAESAKNSLKSALSLAFKGGAITGFTVVGLSLLGVSSIFAYAEHILKIPLNQIPQLLVGFGFGASLISLFARVGGGIFTKAADVGADLVGKIEQNIPEDDPRNPAVIADNVGDNVGDCAGMGADLFETYAVTLVAAMILAATTFTQSLGQNGIEYPMVLGSIAVFASILGSFFVKLGKKNNIMNALYKGTLATAAFSAIGFYFANQYFIGDIKIYLASLVGITVTILINFITEYYTSTSYNPVKKIAKASQTGAGTNIISGLAVGLESTFLPISMTCLAIFLSFWLGETSNLNNGVYGIAIAAVAMLSTTGMVIAMDAYGPITDNAGGIAEMAKLPEKVRKNTDKLDAVGNTTKAVTKGYAICSAGLAALVLFQAYNEELTALVKNLQFNFEITDHLVIIGLFLGGMIPYLFSASCMESVGKAAFSIVEEVRKQFKEKKGILTGTEKPDYEKCVDIVTKSALKEMIFPAILAVISPLLIGFILGPKALGGFLAGILISSLLLALTMCTGGGAWDNAKKLIESGLYGGKGGNAHKAAVIGDTVGDPYKDTAGPALNSLIKVISMVSLLIAPIIGQLFSK